MTHWWHMTWHWNASSKEMRSTISPSMTMELVRFETSLPPSMRAHSPGGNCVALAQRPPHTLRTSLRHLPQ